MHIKMVLTSALAACFLMGPKSQKQKAKDETPSPYVTYESLNGTAVTLGLWVLGGMGTCTLAIVGALAYQKNKLKNEIQTEFQYVNKDLLSILEVLNISVRSDSAGAMINNAKNTKKEKEAS